MARLSTAFLALLLCACAQMPPDVAERVKAIGPVIDPPKTAAIYAPLQQKEPYAGVQVLRDLKYGPDARHALDVFIPDGGANGNFTPEFGQVLRVATEWVIFATILLINTAAALLIAILLMRRPSAPGERALIAMLLLLAVWSFGYAMITLVRDMQAKLFWLRFENVGILSVPVVWFIFTVQYARLDHWLNKFTGGLLFVIPAISLILLFSERWFYIYYSAVQPVSESGGPLVIGRGPWYVVALVNSYIFNLMGMAVLAWCAVQYRDAPTTSCCSQCP